MTNEELGRAYAGARQVAPVRSEISDRWCWTSNQLGNTSLVVHSLAGNVESGGFWSCGFATEALAFTALGEAARRVLAAADLIRGQLSGADMGTAGARQDFKEWVASLLDGDFHLNSWAGLDEDGRNERFGSVADQIVDTAYSHFRFEDD